MSVLILFLVIFVILNILVYRDGDASDMPFSVVCVILIIASAILTMLFAFLFYSIFYLSSKTVIGIIFILNVCFLITYISSKIIKNKEE